MKFPDFKDIFEPDYSLVYKTKKNIKEEILEAIENFFDNNKDLSDENLSLKIEKINGKFEVVVDKKRKEKIKKIFKDASF